MAFRELVSGAFASNNNWMAIAHGLCNIAKLSGCPIYRLQYAGASPLNGLWLYASSGKDQTN
jgi:hypothetical protein